MPANADLDRRDCLILKGLAILAISLHNYFHLLSPIKENEFDFSAQRFFAYLAAVHDPARILQSSASFFGHYGVQVFVFLSAYGLAQGHWSSEPWPAFLWGRVRKIYPMFLLAIGLWALWVGLVRGPLGPVEVLWRQGKVLLLVVLGIFNIVPWHAQLPVGPWWFMPFIMQVYCLWPLLRRCAQRFGLRGLWVLSVVCLAIAYAFNGALTAHWSINLMQTPVGHMPECCLGIAVARFGYRPNWAMAAAATLIFVLGNALQPLWLLSFISGLVAMLWLYQQIRPVLRRSAALAAVGGYSMALFFVNGFVRLPFVLVAARLSLWYLRLLFGLESVGLGLALALLVTVASTSICTFPGIFAARPPRLHTLNGRADE